MAKRAVRILAVADPAVYAYTDPKYALLDAWEKSGEEPAAFDIVPWAEYSAMLERECAATEPSYDVVMIAGHLWLRDYVERGALSPLGARIAALGRDYNDDDILPEIRDEMSWDGERWLVPSFTDGHLGFIDSAAAEELFSSSVPGASSSVPGASSSVPETLSTYQLEAAARRLHANRGVPAFLLKAHPSEIFLDWLPYLLDEGLEPFDGDGNPCFNEARGVKALERYVGMKALSLEESIRAGNDEALAALRSRKALLAVSWGGQAGRIALDDEGFRFFGLEHPWNVTWSFGLLACSANADAAFRFLAHVSSATADKAVGRYAGSPVRESTYVDARERAACPWYPAQRSLISRAYTLPRFSGSGATFGIMYEELASAFACRSTPSGALAVAERRISELRKALR